MSLMSKRAVKTIRRTVERGMVDQLVIRRGSSSEHDNETLRDEYQPGSVIYSGKGRVRPTRGPREQAVSEGVIVMRDADFDIPVDASLPRRDDEVYVSASDDPSLEGTYFRISDVRLFSQQPARQFSGIAAQPSRLWPLEDAT